MTDFKEPPNYSAIAKVMLVGVAFATGAHASMITLDLTGGPPPPEVAQISRLTPTTGLDFNNGRMNVTIGASDDGVDIVVPDFDAVCVIFRDLSLQGFASGAGVSFDMILNASLGNSASFVLVQENSLTAKITDTINGQTSVKKRITFPDIDLSQVTSTRVDWIKGENGAKDQIAAVATLSMAGRLALLWIQISAMAKGRIPVLMFV